DAVAVVDLDPAVVHRHTHRAVADLLGLDERVDEVAVDIDEDGTLDFQETPDSAVTRMRSVLDDVIREHHGERVVIVSHGGAIIACLTDVMHLEPGRLRMLPYYTSISTVRVLGDRRMVG